MPLVLFNGGWMRDYRGQTPSDPIVGGGRHVREHGHGFEVENFLPLDGRCYAHVNNNSIDLARIDSGVEANTEYLDGVTVVFVATRPEGGRVVVGWIIPLIGEYFYDDWERVRAVLGGTDDFVRRELLPPPPGLDDPGEARYRWTVREPPFGDGAYESLAPDVSAEAAEAESSPPT